MKRSLFTTGVTLCALASASGAALAQSSNTFNSTLFGTIDVNVRAVRNGSASTLKSQSTDGLTSSRLGFRGFEDLGDGFKAGFWLEAPFSADTGTANATRFWNRRSTVSLIEPTFGEIRLGRDNAPAFTAYSAYDPFGTNGLGEILGNGTTIGIISALGSGAANLSRSDNQISYFTPATLGGVYGQLAVAPAEAVAGSRYISGRVGYAVGKFDVSGVYTETKVGLNSTLRFKQALVGAAYDFGVAKLSGQVIESRYASAAGGDRQQRVYQMGASVPLGAHVIRVDYVHGNMSGGAAGSGFGDGDDASQIALGYQYNLSKRTALYATAATLRNKGASRLIVAAGNAGMKAGENSTGVDAGLRVSF